MSKRRLTDLYVRGREFEIDDGNGDPIKVWLQKPNPVQQESMSRSANAARTRVMASYKDKNSDSYLSAIDEVHDLWEDMNAMIIFLIEMEMIKITPKIEAELSMEEDSEWAHDNYLQGLRDFWEEEGEQRWYDDTAKEDEEVQNVFNELKRFATFVDEKAKSHREGMRKDFEVMGEDKILDLTVQKHIESKSTQAWFNAYRRAQILFTVRNLEDKTLYFEDKDEVDLLSIEVIRLLIEAIEDLSVDPTQGKD